MPTAHSAIRIAIKLPLLMALSLSLAACGGNGSMDDLQQYIIEVSLRPGGPVEPMPEFLPYEAFTYSAASLRSPFDVPIMAGTSVAETPVTEVKPDFDRTPEALEEFALANLAMVGMITRGSATIALIQDENGSIHRVGRGNYMGRNHGRIISVAPTEIELIEIVPSGDGGWVERPRTLALQR